MQNNFQILSNSDFQMDKNQIFLNSFNTNNRANLMLINCSKFEVLKSQKI